MKHLLCFLLLTGVSGVIFSQTGSTKQQKKVVTFEKKIDKDGNEVIEKKILEGDAIKSNELDEDDDRIIKIEMDSLGNQKKIIINNSTRLDDEYDRTKTNPGNRYQERTVTIKKNPDGSVEIKDKSGDQYSQYMKIDSSDSRKPNIGVSLDDDLKVTLLIKDGAAAIAGLALGDILTHFDGVFINDYDHLKTLLEKKKIGDPVSITYLRDRKEMKSNLTLKGGSTRVYFNR